VVVVTVSLSVLPIVDDVVTLILGGSDVVTKNFPNNGGQCFDYGLMLLLSPWIMQDTRP